MTVAAYFHDIDKCKQAIVIRFSINISCTTHTRFQYSLFISDSEESGTVDSNFIQETGPQFVQRYLLPLILLKFFIGFIIYVRLYEGFELLAFLSKYPAL